MPAEVTPSEAGPASRRAVVDASALAALLFGEPQGARLVEKMRGRQLLAPTLIRYEVASVCLKKMKLHPEARAQLRSALSQFDRLGIQEVSVDPSSVVGVAQETGLTAYDSSYLWLSRTTGAPLVTLDRRLRKAP